MSNQRQLFFEYLGLPSLHPMALAVSQAHGVYLYDEEGREYMDLISGVTVSNLGHGHPEVIRAVTEQAQKYMHLMVYGEYIQSPQVQLAKTLADHLPENLHSVYFVNSGSEAVEGAIKLAKRDTGRTEVIAFRNAYHGGTAGALSILGDERLKNAFRPLVPDVRFLRFNNEEDLRQITERTACVVAETVQAEAGIIQSRPSFMKALRQRCDETGALLVIDDVQMGMGRSGKLFSFEHFGILPDILVLAKAFGGGMPLGAFIASRARMSSLSSRPELGHITTFGGHPVSCAAALASLQIMTSLKPYLNAGELAQRYINRLSSHPEIKEIRHFGLMLALDLESTDKALRFVSILLEEGAVTDLFLFRPNSFRIAPPLIITEEEVDKSCRIILRSLDRL